LTLSRYLGREVLLHFLAVLTVVVGIFLVQRLDALLAEAADGSLPFGMAARLLALRTLTSLPSLCPVVLFLAVVLTLGRMSRDRELVALSTCGVSGWQVAGPVIAFAALSSVVVGWLAFDVRPWAAERLDTAEHQIAGTVELGGLAPGRFYPIDEADGRVLFAEARSPSAAGGGLAGVFLHEIGDRGVSVLASERAVEEREDGDGARLLKLLAGRRYDISPEGGDLEVTDYAEYVIRTPLDPETLGRDYKVEKTSDLFGSDSPADQAELQWRLSMPLSTFLLAFVALPLGWADPRAGKYGRLLVALAIYVVYRQLLGTVKGLMTVGEVAIMPGLWGVHTLLAVVALVLAAYARARPG
jgi:lipopolysaccharide export system permease protein